MRFKVKDRCGRVMIIEADKVDSYTRSYDTHITKSEPDPNNEGWTLSESVWVDEVLVSGNFLYPTSQSAEELWNYINEDL